MAQLYAIWDYRKYVPESQKAQVQEDCQVLEFPNQLPRRSKDLVALHDSKKVTVRRDRLELPE